MRNFIGELAEGQCSENVGCNAAKTCMCALAEDAIEEVKRLRLAITDIQKATVEGRVCDDVAWFDTITTLHDFCHQTLNQE